MQSWGETVRGTPASHDTNALTLESHHQGVGLARPRYRGNQGHIAAAKLEMGADDAHAEQATSMRPRHYAAENAVSDGPPATRIPLLQ